MKYFELRFAISGKDSTKGIGVGRFRIFGGEWGGAGEAEFLVGALRRNDVDATWHRRHFDVMCPQVFDKSEPNNYISHL